MLKRIDLRGLREIPRGLLPRATFDVNSALEQIRPLLDAIASRGADPIRRVTSDLDGVDLGELRVSPDAIIAAKNNLDAGLRTALEESIRRVRIVHERQAKSDDIIEVAPGGTVTTRCIPVRRVGLYVPGGLAPLASSVIMNAVPALIAGVDSIAVSSPPQRDTGLPDETVLAVCGLLGLTEVYAVGGPAAIGMFAYGVDECEPVDIITGPGNIYVTAAKRAVRGIVGIDAEAGTTEIAIIADDSADPEHVAADLISQAEHDPEAASVLITASLDLIAAVENALKPAVNALPHKQRVTIALSGPQSGAVLVDDLDQAIAVADAYAAEHLEIQTQDAYAVAMRIRNAGAIFVGPYSPVSLGDYCAGSNHILPTAGCARHSSGLSVSTFLRTVHIVDYSREALSEVAAHVSAIATAEQLPGHAEAIRVRFP